MEDSRISLPDGIVAVFNDAIAKADAHSREAVAMCLDIAVSHRVVAADRLTAWSCACAILGVNGRVKPTSLGDAVRAGRKLEKRL